MLISRIYKPIIAILCAICCKIHALELNSICQIGTDCTINADYSSIENNSSFNINTINIGDVRIDSVINYGSITSSNNRTFQFGDGSSIGRGEVRHIINYGTITGGIYIYSLNANTLGTITNHGEMRGVYASGVNITINNQGIFKTANDNYSGNAAHFYFGTTTGKLIIENYALKIIESQSVFNDFKGYADKANNSNSHLIIGGSGGVSFKNSNAKIIIDFDGGFELGKQYLISKLITNQNGTGFNNLVDFSRLTLKNKDFYILTQQGEYFSISRASASQITTPITQTHKSNIHTMNNLLLSSNAIIYPQKFKANSTKRKNPNTNRTKKPNDSQT